jgi:hypothetical protein
MRARVELGAQQPSEQKLSDLVPYVAALCLETNLATRTTMEGDVFWRTNEGKTVRVCKKTGRICPSALLPGQITVARVLGPIRLFFDE